MPIESVSDLVQFLTRYPLLGPLQREELDGILKARFTDPRTLAKELLLREWLTPYQVNQVLQGHGPALMLGSYILLERLTEGALGQLFKARHLHMKRTVALQVVRPELLKDPLAVDRFYSEIQAVSQLSHQHLVAAYDAGPIGDTHFFAMEYVEGIDLERQIQQGGPPAVDLACEYIRQTARGLQHAFERGLLHHDLRPANLLVTRTGECAKRNADDSSDFHPNSALVKVRNLGLTLIRQHTKHTRLLIGAGPDTQPPPPDYLAPERPPGSPPGDVRSELYSLGGTFYFLLTGQVPFPGGSAEEKIHRHQTEKPRPVESLRPEVPAEVAALVARLLAKDPADRFAVPREVADALSPEPPEFLDSIAAPPETATRPPAEINPVPRSKPIRARRWRSWAVLGGATLVGSLLLLGGLWLFRGGPAPPTTAEGYEGILPGTLTTVEANRPWQDTYIDVQAGKPITLFASGWWHGGPRRAGCSPDGDKKQPLDRRLIAAGNPMALVGWVAGEDAPFVIGVRKTHEPKVSGRLFVQANDLDVKDNSGQVKLQVQGGVANACPAPLWQVGYGRYGPSIKHVKDFHPMPYWPKAGRWQPGPEKPYKQFGHLCFSPSNAHPGPKQLFSVVLRWLVPRDGVVAVSGTLTHPKNAGDGVRARLFSSRSGPLAPPWKARNGKTETKVPKIEVKQGDIIDAVVDCNGNDADDTFSWSPTIKVLEWRPLDKK